MKKAILSILLLTGFVSIHAQNTRFAITGGATFATLKAKESGLSITSDTKVGFTIGALAEIPVGEQFVFQPGLNFTQKGGKLKFSDAEFSTEDKETLNYLELPLNFLYQTDAGSGKFFAGAGPVLSYGIGGKSKSKTNDLGVITEDNSDIKFGNDETKDDYKPFEFSGNILAGYELSNGAFIAVNYNLGFSNIAIGSGSGSVKNRYFGIRIGYKFGGKSSKK